MFLIFRKEKTDLKISPKNCHLNLIFYMFFIFFKIKKESCSFFLVIFYFENKKQFLKTKSKYVFSIHLFRAVFENTNKTIFDII